MPIKRRKKLGSRLPAIKDPVPTADQADAAHAMFDNVMPEWAGVYDPKPKGTTPAPRFYRDEITGVVTRASTGAVVGPNEWRLIMDEFTKRVRGTK